MRAIAEIASVGVELELRADPSEAKGLEGGIVAAKGLCDVVPCNDPALKVNVEDKAGLDAAKLGCGGGAGDLTTGFSGVLGAAAL